jgi:Ni/Co efflux regulator RcnB
MRASTLAMITIAVSMTAFQATAQQAAPTNQTREQINNDADKRLKTDGPSEQMQRDADKGTKTRNSGESGFVADQDKSGASAHPPGQPGTDQTTGSSSGSQSNDPK